MTSDSDDKLPVRRVVSWYNKNTDEWIGEAEIAASLGELREIFGQSTEEPMYDSFPIYEEQARFVEMRTGIKIKLGDFDYFLECSVAL
jgi:hypothetical protein